MSVFDAVGRAVESVVGHEAEIAGVKVVPRNVTASAEVLGAGAMGDIGNLWKRTLQAGRTVLNGMGEGGQQLAQGMDQAFEQARLRAGADHDRAIGFVRGMNTDEVHHVADILDGTDAARHPKYQAAADGIRGVLNEYSDDASSLGIDTIAGSKYATRLKQLTAQGVPYHEATAQAASEARRPFTPREDYLPHYYDEGTIAKYLTNGPEKEARIQMMLNMGLGNDRREAEQILEQMLRQPGEFRGGPLSHARELLLPGYERDLRKILPRYFSQSAKFLETKRTFGPRDEVANQLINQITGDGHDGRIAGNLWLAFTDSSDPRYKNLARATNAVHSITLLSTAGIVQPAQLMNTVARTGWTNTLRGMSDVMKDWIDGTGSRSNWAISTGATLDSIQNDLTVNSIGDISRVWMRLIGMEHLDRYNRVVSALAGRHYAGELAGQLVRAEGPEQVRIARMVQRLGLDPDSIVERGGKLTNDELRMAGYRTAADTQFASMPLDLPEMRTTPAGRFMYLFKSFAFQQWQFVHRELVQEWNKGNRAPMLRYGAALPGVGFLMGEAVRALHGRQAPDDPKVRALEDFAMVGAFGMFYDAARAMGSGPGSVMNWVAGPAAGELAQVAGADLPPLVQPLVQGEAPDFKPLMHHLVRRTPLVGSYIYNTMMKE